MNRKELEAAVWRNANLRNADLSNADLSNADLHNADLRNANLSNANLSNADLSNANLSNADLSNADLHNANLRNANLRNANLSNADLRNANLSNADLSNANLTPYLVCPEVGSFVGWKKLCGGIIAKLEIPEEAARITPIGQRKCRAAYARVLSLSGSALAGTDTHTAKLVYVTGQIVRPDSFDPDVRSQCSHGIHFFITRKEAEDY